MALLHNSVFLETVGVCFRRGSSIVITRLLVFFVVHFFWGCLTQVIPNHEFDSARVYISQRDFRENIEEF